MTKQPMTVKELCRILSDMPQEALVFIYDDERYTEDWGILAVEQNDIKVDYAMETNNVYYPYAIDDDGELTIVLIG